MFSSRVPGDLTPNALTVALNAMRARGEAIVDLTASNPTRAGFDYPLDLLTPLAEARGLTYSPEPLGQRHARQAVVAEFARRGRRVGPDTIALTASTSEAYSLLFKVLCNAGDEVLIPRPSYPLFEHLTQLDLVTGVPYDLEYHAGWTIDVASLEAALTPRTRAVLVVSPNNPTGNFISAAELAAWRISVPPATLRSFPTRCSPTIRWRPTPRRRRDG
jgi:aspartate/methionine/tyrosine aminotransferase